MARIKIEYDRNGCIGASVCVSISPETWELDDEAKSILKGGKDLGKGHFERIVDIKNPDKLKKEIEAAKGCPVKVIKVTNLDTGERLV